MADEKDDKGFKVFDRRGREEQPSPPPAPPPGAAAPEGNQPPPPGVKEEKGRVGEGTPLPGVPRFLDLVQSLQVGAMIGLGMLKGPDGKRPPVDLPAAKEAIDLLGVLQEKTKGNLTKDEDQVLREGLYHLRMGFMAMTNTPPAGRNQGGDQR